MKTEILYDYLKCRAQIEGVSFDLTPDYLENYFNIGVREFFGIRLGEDGNLCHDEQVPKEYPGLLTSFLELKKIKGESETITVEELTKVHLN